MDSIWYWDTQPPGRRPLKREIRADAVVIGGGMAGILTACALTGAGLHTVVLEADTLGSGQTGRTTAKLTAQHGPICQRLIRQLGERRARLYVQANQAAIEDYRRLARSGLNCDFMDCPSYLYSRKNDPTLVREAAACQKLGLDAAFTLTTTLPFAVKAAVRMEGQAMFQPLKLLYGVAQELEVYEHTPALRVEGEEVVTPEGKVTAPHIIFAVHYPYLRFPGFYFVRMRQERSYVAAFSGAPQLDGIYYSVDPDGLSLRNAGPYLLAGGGGHPTGQGADLHPYAMLEAQVRHYWPDAVPAARWSAQDCMTLDGLPYVGVFSPTRPNWYVATGFQKWGMTASMVAARVLCAQITGQNHPLSPILSPRRFSWQAARRLAQNGGRAAAGLGKRFLSRPRQNAEELPQGQGGVVNYQSRKLGAYRDGDGALHLVSTHCPHMGCQLSWNPEEHTWDCPCHGSRFHWSGKLIDGPAQRDLDSGDP